MHSNSENRDYYHEIVADTQNGNLFFYSYFFYREKGPLFCFFWDWNNFGDNQRLFFCCGATSRPCINFYTKNAGYIITCKSTIFFFFLFQSGIAVWPNDKQRKQVSFIALKRKHYGLICIREERVFGANRTYKTSLFLDRPKRNSSKPNCWSRLDCWHRDFRPRNHNVSPSPRIIISTSCIIMVREGVVV